MLSHPPSPTPPVSVGESVFAYKTEDQSVADSALAIPITDLSVDLEAGYIYHFQAWVPFALAGTASGYKFSIGAPGGFDNISYRERITDGVTPALIKEIHRTSIAGITGALAVIGTHFFELDGTIETGDASGEFFLRMAQGTSDADAITVKRGAFFQITRKS